LNQAITNFPVGGQLYTKKFICSGCYFYYSVNMYDNVSDCIISVFTIGNDSQISLVVFQASDLAVLKVN